MTEVNKEVQDRLDALNRYQELAPRYLEAVEAEKVAMVARVEIEAELREIVNGIGKDPAGILPKRRRTKAELNASEAKPKAKAKAKPKDDEPPVADMPETS